jgi:hypothetical protein
MRHCGREHKPRPMLLGCIAVVLTSMCSGAIQCSTRLGVRALLPLALLLDGSPSQT